VENPQLAVGWGDFVDELDDEPESLDEPEEPEEPEDESLDEDDGDDEEDSDEELEALSAEDCLPRLSLR